MSIQLTGPKWFSYEGREWAIYCCGPGLPSEPQIWKLRVVVWHITSMKCTEVRPTRAARLFSLVQPIISSICCIDVAVAVVVSLTPFWATNGTGSEDCSWNTLSRLLETRYHVCITRFLSFSWSPNLVCAFPQTSTNAPRQMPTACINVTILLETTLALVTTSSWLIQTTPRIVFVSNNFTCYVTLNSRCALIHLLTSSPSIYLVSGVTHG